MHTSLISKVVAGVAVLFGILTLFAGTRALLGADPGYIVFRPLLQFNTVMGAAYVLVGLLAWRKPKAALYGAALITVFNLLMLGVVAFLYASQGPVATESIRAMTFRTVVWLILFGLLAKERHRRVSER